MNRKKDEMKRKRAFIELQEVTKNISNKVSLMPNNIPMVAQDQQPIQLRQDTLVKMQILAEKRKQSDLQNKAKQYADEVKKVNQRAVNKYLVPLNPRVYMAPRPNPITVVKKLSPQPSILKLSSVNPDLEIVSDS